MQFIATQKNIRQTPRKIRLVANQVKDLPLDQALRQLAVIQRRSTLVLLKTIKQAMANAKNNHGIAVSDLAIDQVLVMEGPRFKRWQAVSRGRAHSLVKRTSHLRVVLKTKDAQPLTEQTTVAQTKAMSVTKPDVKQVAKPTAPTKTKAKPVVARRVSAPVKPIKKERAVKAIATPKNIIRKSTTSK